MLFRSKDITGTDAGEELNRELNEQIRRHKLEMQGLKEEMEQAMKDKDEETKKDLEAGAEEMMKLIEKLENDSQRLESDFKKEKERFEALMQQKELEAKEEAELIKAHYQQEIERLTELLKGAVTQHEKDKKQKKIDELSRKAVRTRPNFFSKFAGWVDSVTVT